MNDHCKVCGGIHAPPDIRWAVDLISTQFPGFLGPVGMILPQPHWFKEKERAAAAAAAFVASKSAVYLNDGYGTIITIFDRDFNWHANYECAAQLNAVITKVTTYEVVYRSRS